MDELNIWGLDLKITKNNRWTFNNSYINDDLFTPLIEFCIKNKYSDIYITQWENIKVKRGDIIDLSNLNVNFSTKYNDIEFEKVIKNIFSEEDDYQNYLSKMWIVGEFDYWIWFETESTNLRLRLHFVNNIRGVTLIIRPLLFNIPSPEKLTDISWSYTNSDNEYLSDDIKYELKKMSHVWSFIMNNFNKWKWLILITWKTWSWKSTLTTSFLNKLLEEKDLTLVTIEDPVEYIFNKNKNITSEVIQIEIPTHVESFQTAIKWSKREHPDVVYIQEIRDKESALALIDLVGAWHLVVTTLHTWSISETFSRLSNLVWNEHKELMKEMLSEQLLCVINQKLLRFKIEDKIIEIWIQEFLQVTWEIKKHIKESAISQINGALIDSPPHTSITKLLWLLLKSNQITVDQFLENITDINILPQIIWSITSDDDLWSQIKKAIKWDIPNWDIKRICEAYWIKFNN